MENAKIRFAQILDFAEQMQIELDNNEAKKGLEWQDWDNVPEMICELDYHKGKLLKALKDKEHELVKEYIADCANFLMFIGNSWGLYSKGRILSDNQTTQLREQNERLRNIAMEYIKLLDRELSTVDENTQYHYDLMGDREEAQQLLKETEQSKEEEVWK